MSLCHWRRDISTPSTSCCAAQIAASASVSLHLPLSGSSRGPEQLPEEARRQVGHDQGTARGDHDKDQEPDEHHGPIKTLLRVCSAKSEPMVPY